MTAAVMPAIHDTDAVYCELMKNDSRPLTSVHVNSLLRQLCPQTYLQRPSPWGRATAERQDVESHSYRNAEDILSTFTQPADVSSHHLEY